MNPRALSALSLVNDLRHAAFDALDRKHKYPALLLFYSFIDICATLADEAATTGNRARFENFVTKYALLSWGAIRPYDLWAARSSLLHAYSPLGEHTSRGNGATPIFYFAWPETEEEMRQALSSKGYGNFLLVDIETIKDIAVSTFNAMWSRVENEPEFEAVFLRNAEHLLKGLFHLRLEDELVLLAELAALKQEVVKGGEIK